MGDHQKFLSLWFSINDHYISKGNKFIFENAWSDGIEVETFELFWVNKADFHEP
jgi:hypothetical protein